MAKKVQKFGLVKVTKTVPSGYIDGSWQDRNADIVKSKLYDKSVSLENICNALNLPINSDSYEYFFYPKEGKATIKPVTNGLYEGEAYKVSWKVEEDKPSYEDLEKRVANLEKLVTKLMAEK